MASVSVVAPGNTAQMAQWIQEYVGGELFPIVVTEIYPDNYDECMERETAIPRSRKPVMPLNLRRVWPLTQKIFTKQNL